MGTVSTTRRRTARGLSVLLSLFTVIVLAGAGSALAQGGYNDGGPPNGNGSGGGTGDPNGGGSSNYQCGQNIGGMYGALYVDEGAGWKVANDVAYQNCLNSNGNWTNTGRSYDCQVGFEVYRFYGTQSGQLLAATRSRDNNENWCNDSKNYRFPAQTSWDALVTGPSGADYNQAAANPDRQNNLLDPGVSFSESGLLTPGPPTPVLGDCRQVSKRNPMIDLYNAASPARKIAYRAEFGQQFHNIAYSSAQQLPLTAAKDLSISTISGLYTYNPAAWTDHNSPPAYDPGADPNVDQWFATDLSFSDKECASPFNFATVRDATTNQPIGSVVESGTCYIPVVRNVSEVTNNGVNRLNFRGLGRGFGERLSVLFAGANGDAATPASWRQFMYDDYLARAAGGITGAQGTQILPAQARQGQNNAAFADVGEAWDPTATAAEMRDYSRCRLGTQVQLTNGDPNHGLLGCVGEGEVALPAGTQDCSATGGGGGGSHSGNPGGPSGPTGKVRVNLSDPKVLQAAGTTRRATFTESSYLDCSSGCPDEAQLISVRMATSFQGPGGYRECTGAEIANCDYRVVSAAPEGSSTIGTRTWVLEFYNPTLDTQSLRMVVAGLHATWQYTVTYPGVTTTTTDASGNTTSSTTPPTKKTFTVEENPTLVGEPQPAVGTPGGEFHVDYPVIGAVNVPK